MSDMTIFKNPNAPASVAKRGQPSALAKTLASSFTHRRIQTNTNGTFKRLVNGEPMGKALRSEINVIIVGALPKVSRIFYEGKYDPNQEATLPNCWSNLGDVPEVNVPDRQSDTCDSCPNNIKGSGDNGGKACRYQRRIAVMVEGDTSGDIYQFNVPAKSLFGKGVGNVHPFESYIKFLLANGKDPDGVVTNIKYDDEADTMELMFTPVRHITDEEYELVTEAQAKPEATMYTKITVGNVDKVEKLPAPTKPVKIQRADDPEDDDDEDEAPAPPPKKKKKPAPAPVVEDDEEEEEEVPVPPPPKKKKPAPVVEDDEEEEVPEPKKRPSKTRTVDAVAAPGSDLSTVISDWLNDD